MSIKLLTLSFLIVFICGCKEGGIKKDNQQTPIEGKKSLTAEQFAKDGERYLSLNETTVFALLENNADDFLM